MENQRRLNFSKKIYSKLIRLYPRAYRQRFGQELVQTFCDMYNEHPARAWLQTAIDLLISLPIQHAANVRNFMQTEYPTIKNPSVWIPIAMSLAALGVILVDISLFGVVHQKDEGTAAHLFQILMAGQVPVIAFFVVKWSPHAPKKVFMALALQIGVALLPVAVVFFLKL